MRVSTRIVAGFATLVILAAVTVAYQLSVIHRMQTVNSDLASVDFEAASIALRMKPTLDTLEEFANKYFTVDPAFYEDLLDERMQDFAGELTNLQQIVRTDREKAAVESLSQVWAEFGRKVGENRAALPQAGYAFLPITISDAISRLQAQMDLTYQTIQLAIRERVTNAAKTGAAAQRFSVIAGAVALVLGIVVAVVIVGAIGAPLKKLTRSTRLIAKGQFWHRLPAHGSDEFAELAKDFNTMTERLGELDQMKKDFVSHVSHDLKAPLASIRQTMHLLLQEIPGSLNGQQKRLLRLAYGSAERLAAMVGNLLDISRIEAGTMEYELDTYDLAGIVHTVAEEFEIQAKEKKINFRVEAAQAEVFVKCDRDRIAQVVGNLFENALKFSPAGSDIIARIQSGDGIVRLSVLDSGPGVPNQHKDRIFLKFHQVKRGKKIAGQGVGLGLAICWTIVEAHKGSIWVDDNPSGGSIFNMTLQAAAKAEAIHKI